jgi:EAL domain-containing protein (putative c-di-GMP-specific phosphodiesterase class I)
MISPSVLVIGNETAQNNAVVHALGQLGVTRTLQATNEKDAIALLRMQGGVDVAICNMTLVNMDYLAFLRRASQFGMVRAVMLYGESRSTSHRAVEQMALLSGLELLGTLSKPLQLKTLQKILRRFSRHCLVKPPMAKKLMELPTEEDIRRGLAMGEFRAHFQHKCSLTSGKLVGAEVLARWHHSTKGPLLPKDFLAAVLAYDLIDELFMQLLEQGLSLQALLRSQDQHIELAFNLHASQFSRNGLTSYIKQRLAYHELPGSDLIFELAENGLLEMHEATQAELLQLRMMGCGLAIDDFGAGFSSLKLLCLLPFTQIKLDAGFVQNLQKPENRAAITTTQALAQSLNMELIVEGVTQKLQHMKLLEMGCRLGQGSYYSYPMTPHALISLNAF